MALLAARHGVASALIAAWLALAPPALAQERVAVVTTTTDLRSLAEAVGGERVAVASLVPPDIDAEEYQPKPQDVLRLKTGALVVRVGLDYDLWLDRLLAQAGRPEISRGGPGYVDASFGIAVLEIRGMSVGPGDGHAHGSGNPHYWLDPKNAEIITGDILEALARIDPANAAAYEANRAAFLARLQAKARRMGGEARAAQGACRSSPTTTAGRISRAASASTSSGSSSRSPACRRARRIWPAWCARCRRATCASSCASRTSRSATRVLAGKAGAAVVVLAGSVGALPQAGDYFALFDTNVAALLAAAAMIEALALLWPPFLVAICWSASTPISASRC